MTIDVFGPQALQREPLETAEFGNLRGKVGQVELAALAQNKTAAVCKVPPYCTLVGCLWAFDALGANTSIAIGTEKMTAGTAVTAALKATAATTSGSAGAAVFEPIATGSEGLYITVTNTGSGAATGTASLTPLYIHNGG